MSQILNNSSNISSNSYSESVGGLVYFLLYISDYLPYVILVSCASLIGLIGNTIIILTIIINKELHSATYMLIFNLALVDLVISGFVDSSTVLSVFIGEQYFNERPELCGFIGAVCFIACTTSLFNLGFLAINRYVRICHRSLYHMLYSTKLTLLYCLISWLYGILVDLPHLTGWAGHIYDKKTLSCVWNRLASLSYSLFGVIVCIITPCVLIFLFYMKIFIFSYKSKAKARSLNRNHSLRLAQGLFVSFMLFAICWLPYGLIVMLDFADRLPRSAIMFTMTLGHMNSSLNSILYALFNPAFRRGCANLFNKICCCVPICKLNNNRVINVDDTNRLAQAQTLHTIKLW